MWVVTCTSETMNVHQHIEYERNREMELSFVYMLFSLFWICQFILACEEYIIAAVITRYYLLKNQDQMNLTMAVYRLFRYNFGSVLGCATYLMCHYHCLGCATESTCHHHRLGCAHHHVLVDVFPPLVDCTGNNAVNMYTRNATPNG